MLPEHEQEKKKGSVGSKRPTLKRPTIQRAAPRSSPKHEQLDSSSSPHSTQTSLQVPSSHRVSLRSSCIEMCSALTRLSPFI